MRISVYLPLALSLVLALAAPLLARRLPPAQAARTLAASAALSAAASTWGLALLALTLLTLTPPAIERGATEPVPLVIALSATTLLALGAGRTALVLRRRSRTQAAMRRLCQLCQPTGELAIVADTAPNAFAVPGRPGRILLTTGLLKVTDAIDRRVVLAHERAHLRHAHHLLRATTEVAAALNPLLGSARTAVSYLVERWADEAAAAEVGSRRATATSLAKVALATSASPTPPWGASPALAFHRHAVTARVQALRTPPTRPHPALVAAALLLSAGALLAAGDATLALSRVLLHLAGG